MRKTILLLTCVLAVSACMSEKQPKPLNMDNEGVEIVCFGDSLTEGMGSEDGNTYPFYLSLETSMPVVTQGYRGMTTDQARLAIEKVKVQNPYMVIIEFGANDLMKGVPLERTKKNMEALVDEVQRLGAIAVIVDIGGRPEMAPYTKIFKEIAKEKKALFVPGVMDSIFNEASFKSDEIHPNSEGYHIMSYQIFSVIKPFLKKGTIS